MPLLWDGRAGALCVEVRVRLRFDGRVVRLPEASPLGVAKLGDHSLNPRLTLGSVVAIDTLTALYLVFSCWPVLI
jgi:hypothetical protein